MSEFNSDPDEIQNALSRLTEQFSSVQREPLSPARAKHNQERWKKFSRRGTRKYRQEIFQRCSGCCEVCGFMCQPILNLHHVRPVNKSGMPTPNNLIALCPNCHEAIHKVDTKSKDFNEWAKEVYTAEQLALLFALAHEKVKLDPMTDKWRSEE